MTAPDAFWLALSSVGGPKPWAGGPRILYLRVPPTALTDNQVSAP